MARQEPRSREGEGMPFQEHPPGPEPLGGVASVPDAPPRARARPQAAARRDRVRSAAQRTLARIRRRTGQGREQAPRLGTGEKRVKTSTTAKEGEPGRANSGGTGAGIAPEDHNGTRARRERAAYRDVNREFMP